MGNALVYFCYLRHQAADDDVTHATASNDQTLAGDKADETHTSILQGGCQSPARWRRAEQLANSHQPL